MQHLLTALFVVAVVWDLETKLWFSIKIDGHVCVHPIDQPRPTTVTKYIKTRRSVCHAVRSGLGSIFLEGTEE